MWAEDREPVEIARDVTSIEEIAETLGVQQHDRGLSCPNPDHYQSGGSAPASEFEGSDGVRYWRCHGCGERGDAINFVKLALDCSFGEAIEWLLERGPVSGTPRTHTPKPRVPGVDRSGPVTEPKFRDLCEAYCSGRGWLLKDMRSLLRRQFEFRAEGMNCMLRLYQVEDWHDYLKYDDEQPWYQDRFIVGPRYDNGDRWRFRAGMATQLTYWQPSYSERVRRVYRDTSISRRGHTVEIDHTPDPLPPTLVTEGGSDFLTAVLVQARLPIGQRFPVISLPGAGAAAMLEHINARLTVIVDNDEAGDRCRERIAELRPDAHHIYVDAPHDDLSDSWLAAWQADESWIAIPQWITELREALEPQPQGLS